MVSTNGRVLVSLDGNDIAPRFDLSTEVMISTLAPDGSEQEKTLVLPQASAEKLCHMIVSEEITAVICGGIELEYLQYLGWKHVVVFDSVIGPRRLAVEKYRKGLLRSGDILLNHK